MPSLPPGATFRYGPTTFDARPQLTRYVASVVASGALIESHWAGVLAEISRADPRAALAMLRQHKSTDAQIRMILAVGKLRLPPVTLALMKAVIDVAKPAREVRNRFCHEIWGWSDDLPDALLLIPQDAPLGMISSFDGPPEIVQADLMALKVGFAGISVYRQAELEAAELQCIEASNVVGLLRLELGHDATLKRLSGMQITLTPQPPHTRLSAWPSIEAARQKLSRGRRRTTDKPIDD